MLITHDSTQAVITCKNRDTNGIKSLSGVNQEVGGGGGAEERERGEDREGVREGERGEESYRFVKDLAKKQSKKGLWVAGDGRIMTEGGGYVTSDDLWLGCWEELKEMGATATLSWWDILPPVHSPLFLR